MIEVTLIYEIILLIIFIVTNGDSILTILFFRYTASDETGFVAEVTYEGEAVFPDTKKRRI